MQYFRNTAENKMKGKIRKLGIIQQPPRKEEEDDKEQHVEVEVKVAREEEDNN